MLQDFYGESTLVIQSPRFQCSWVVFHMAMAKVTVAGRNCKALIAWFDFISEPAEVLRSALLES